MLFHIYQIKSADSILVQGNIFISNKIHFPFVLCLKSFQNTIFYIMEKICVIYRNSLGCHNRVNKYGGTDISAVSITYFHMKINIHV